VVLRKTLIRTIQKKTVSKSNHAKEEIFIQPEIIREQRE
jgi:hypothetical protein